MLDGCLQRLFRLRDAGRLRHPEIELQGSEDDWNLIIERFTVLEGYGLGAWVASLKPVLEAIARTASGEVDRAFWESFFRYRSGSGPSELTGWILTLFPYLTDPWTDALQPNPYLGLAGALRAARAAAIPGIG